jgi:hypothetical protein
VALFMDNGLHEVRSTVVTKEKSIALIMICIDRTHHMPSRIDSYLFIEP